MFTVTTKETKTSTKGILYLLVISIDEKDVIKIGVTNRDKIEDRVCEILVSIFKSYRFFPMLYPKRFSKVDNNYEKEQKLLSYLSEYKYESKAKFGGSTELVDMDLDIVVDLYDKLKVADVEFNENGNICGECGKVMKFEKDGKACCGYGHTN